MAASNRKTTSINSLYANVATQLQTHMACSDLLSMQKTNRFFEANQDINFWRRLLKYQFGCCDSFIRRFNYRQLKMIGFRLSHIKVNDIELYTWLSTNVLQTDTIDFSPLYAEVLPPNIPEELYYIHLFAAARCGNDLLVSWLCSPKNTVKTMDIAVQTVKQSLISAVSKSGYLPAIRKTFALMRVDNIRTPDAMSFITETIKTKQLEPVIFLLDIYCQHFVFIDIYHETLMHGGLEVIQHFFSTANVQSPLCFDHLLILARLGDVQSAKWVSQHMTYASSGDTVIEGGYRKSDFKFKPITDQEITKFYLGSIISGNMEMIHFAEEIIERIRPQFLPTISWELQLSSAAQSGSLAIFLYIINKLNPEIIASAELQQILEDSLPLAAEAGGLSLVKYLMDEKHIVLQDVVLMKAINSRNYALVYYLTDTTNPVRIPVTMEHIKQATKPHKENLFLADFAILDRLFALGVESHVVTNENRSSLLIDNEKYHLSELTKHYIQTYLFPKLNRIHDDAEKHAIKRR